MDLADKELYIVGGDTRRYGNLKITHRGRTQTLDLWIHGERKSVSAMNDISQLVEGHILEAHKHIDRFSSEDLTVDDTEVLCHLDDAQYAGTIDVLSNLLLGPAEARHSPQARRLMKLGIDYLIKSHRKFLRKNGSPYSVHPFMVARLVAAQGASFPTIIAGMLHDRVEESVDSFKKRREREGKKAAKNGVADRASGILYSTGLYFYEQVRGFTFSQRYFADINSIVDIIDKMSRTDGQTYYEYLEKLFYPMVPKRRPMNSQRFRESLDFDVQKAILFFNDLHEGGGDAMVGAYLEDVDKYYMKYLGRDDNEPSDEEKKRETYRVMMNKLADRLHNTCDMDPAKFSIPKRLYSLGYKNAYFIQHLELKLCRQKQRSLDMTICLDLIMDLRLATLSQLLHDEEALCSRLSDEQVKNIRDIAESYKKTPAFQKVTSVDEGGVLDGLIHQYDKKAQGDRSIFKTLDGNDELQLLHVLAFQSLFENYLAYAAGCGPDPRYKVKNFDIKLARRRGNGFATTTLRRSVRR